MGKVYLVGAGPGDPDLFTELGRQILSQADVVLYDYLVHPTILTYSKSTSELICVGKKRGYHSQAQADINKQLVHYARQGKQVVRLKGGDPMVFGRGGEELAFLRNHGISCDVIPGISSVFGCLARVGISVSHRELARSVAILSGSLKCDGDVTNLTIPQADTLIFVMGVKHLSKLVDQIYRLTQFNADTPVCVIQHGTVSAQIVIDSTLCSVVNDAVAITNPALIVVGKMAGLRDQSVNQTDLLLSGKRFLIFRPLELANKLILQLKSNGAEVVHTPLIQLISRANELNESHLKNHTMVLFTSQTTVKLFITRLLSLGIDARWFFGKRIVAVGPATQNALEAVGLFADIVPDSQFSQLGILNRLPSDLSSESILYPHSSLSDPFLSQSLQDRGAAVTAIPLYDCIPDDRFPLFVVDGDYVFFSSPSIVDRFYNHPSYTGQCVNAVYIGNVTKRRVLAYQTERLHSFDDFNLL